MASNQRPTSLTPSKIPTPTKRVPRPGADDKICVICQRKFSQQDRNYRLLTTDFAERITRVVCSNFFTITVHLHPMHNWTKMNWEDDSSKREVHTVIQHPCQLAEIKENGSGLPTIIQEQSGRLILELEEFGDHFLRLTEKTSPERAFSPCR